MEILFAEDDRILRQSLADLLTARGYSVRTAVDGLQALAFYRDGLVGLRTLTPRLASMLQGKSSPGSILR